MMYFAKTFLCFFVICASCTSPIDAIAATSYDKCITALANDLTDVIMENIDVNNDGIVLSSDMMVEFFVNNIDLCRDYLLSRQSPENDISISDPDLIVDVRWDYLIEEVSAALTTNANFRQMFVCENNRGWQAGIDAALWATTAVSAILSFGTGGVAVAGGKAAVKQGVKNMVKIGINRGAKTTATEAAVKATAQRLGADLAAKEAAVAAAEAAKNAGANAATIAARDAAVAAAKQASNAAAKNTIIAQTTQSLKKSGAKRVTDAMIRKEIEKTLGSTGVLTAAGRGPYSIALNLLDDKAAKVAAKRTAEKALQTEVATLATNLGAAQAALTAEHAAAQAALKSAMTKFAISTPLTALGGIASIYSFLSSDLNTNVMNCKNTHANSKCYLSCTKDSLAAPTDDLNTKVFKHIFGKNLCIDENANYVLREISSDGLPVAGSVFITTNEKWQIAKQKIVSEVQDKGNCDRKINDIDMYVASPIYDPSTLEPAGDGATGLLIDAIRIDD